MALPELSKFNWNNTDPTEWLDRVKNYKVKYDVPPILMMQFIENSLEGKARKWWKNCSQERSYNTFLRVFRIVFCEDNETENFSNSKNLKIEPSINSNNNLKWKNNKRQNNIQRESDKNYKVGYVCSSQNYGNSIISKQKESLECTDLEKEELIAKNSELKLQLECSENQKEIEMVKNITLKDSLKEKDERLQKALIEINIKNREIDELNRKLHEIHKNNDHITESRDKLNKSLQEIEIKNKIISDLSDKLKMLDFKEKERKETELKYKARKSATINSLLNRMNKISCDINNVSVSLGKIKDISKSKSVENQSTYNAGHIKSYQNRDRSKYVWKRSYSQENLDEIKKDRVETERSNETNSEVDNESRKAVKDKSSINFKQQEKDNNDLLHVEETELDITENNIRERIKKLMTFRDNVGVSQSGHKELNKGLTANKNSENSKKDREEGNDN